jgi:N-methylhydantoinase A/oxoprolinase/acetone carboxylase beta subunit
VSPAESHPAEPAGTRRCWTGGAWREVPVFDRPGLRPGAAFPGPCLVFESHSATFVGEEWEGRVDGAGNLVLTRTPAVE